MTDASQATQLLKARIDKTADQRKAVLDSYEAGEWDKLAPIQQTVRALEHVQQYELATELLDRVARVVPPTGEFESIGAPADDELGERIFEQLIGRSEIMPIRFVHKGSNAAPSIGRIVLRSARQPNGTGFLVSPRLLLTNFHVLPSMEDATANLVQFDFVSRADGSSSTPVEFELRPEVLFVQSPIDRLDFSLVAVEPVNSDGAELARFGWCRLLAQPGKEHPGQRVNVVHHPAGNPKQVSLRENFLVLILDDYLHYMTDTMAGSSGSPVFNDEWEVVALHHAGIEIDETEAAGYRQAIGSSLPEGVTASDAVLVNEGARVSRVVAELQERAAGLSGEAHLLLEEVLAAAPPGPEIAQIVDLAQFVGDGSTGSFSVGAGPVTITVQVGSSGPSPSRSSGSSLLELFRGSDEKSVIRGLGSLQRRREEPYLPSNEVVAERLAEYYGDLPDRVAADDLNPEELYDELNALISEEGTLAIATSFPERLEGLESTVTLENRRYARSRAHLYTSVDLQEDRMLRCIYSDTVIAPEALLLKDLITELDLDDDLPPRLRNNRFLNCEHIVPRSWFDNETIATADLHHLITADGAANGFRSNNPYRDLSAVGEASDGPANRPPYVATAGLRTTSPQQFEPHRGKPVVARATLYFLVAHKQKIDAAPYGAAELEMLRAWSNEEPPSAYEHHRNESIFEIQENRNPFIDFPDWVDLVDFSLGLG